MPTPEATYFNLKRLHVVFATASLALLAVTVWMIAADHWREWKVYQRTFRDRIEPWLTEAWSRDRRTEAYSAQEEELLESLAEARQAVPDPSLIRRFCEELSQQGVAQASRLPQDDTPSSDVAPAAGGERAGADDAQAADIGPIEAACEALAAQPSAEAREALLTRLRKHVRAAESARQRLQRELRFRRAEFDEGRSFYEAAVGEGLAEDRLAGLRERARRAKEEVDAVSARADAASAHCEALAAILAEITRPEDDAQKALAQHREAVERLERAAAGQRPNLARRLLRLPLVDAFGRPLAVDQIWLPELTIDYHFRRVARFDRCTTCHQGIDKTVPGSPSEPACLSQQRLTVELALPSQPPAEGGLAEPILESLYGFALAPEGMLDPGEATIGLVRAKTPAADAGLLAGDVILAIDGAEITGRADAGERLLQAAARPRGSRDEASGMRLDIRRGLPHPYASHPRLDLFVGSLSPHPKSRFGCTVCHRGQGSATAFKFASHSPNDLAERARWRREYGWFWNEHWDEPMLAERFVESSCLRCHHEVTDLAPSRRFPDPPAPKLSAGYHLVRRLGCFGCHEIKGVGVAGERLGPDMRLEGHTSAADPVPGTMRKIGPSLMSVADKLDAAFIGRWLADPQAVRPDTRMPRIYGLWEHLEGKSLDDAKRFEAAEVYAVAEYLLGASQPVAPSAQPSEATGPPSPDRGKRLFLTLGCAACHKHRDYPEVQSVQGPSLSDLGAKLATEAGRAWLVSWIRDPARHSPRTLMPNMLLEPMPLGSEDCDGSPDQDNAPAAFPRMTDPAADIAAYLLASPDAGQPSRVSDGRDATVRQPSRLSSPAADVRDARPAGALVEADLDELVLMHLGKAITAQRARAYLAGRYELRPEECQGDLIELAGRVTRAKKLRYLGRRTIAKRGCFGCHDIPGFENARPIGPALSDWGRKQESLLAFEQVHQFLRQSSGQGPAASTDPGARTDPDRDFYLEAVLSHRREGFIWQKLRAPRSFDYRKTENKLYNEQLTMGRFTLTPDEREAIITFVLGLVADPPAEAYIPRGDRRRQAIVEGGKVLDRYGCAECHVLEMERWQLRYDPAQLEGPPESEDFPFLKPQVDREKLEASARLDRRGLMHAEAVGMPQRDDSGAVLEDVDDDDQPLYFLNLWEPLWLKLQDRWATWNPGGAQLGVSDPLGVAARAPAASAPGLSIGAAGELPPQPSGGASPAGLTLAQQRLRPTCTPHLAAIRPAVGGAFAQLLFPALLEEARRAGSTATVMEAWGWGPPPLVGEGAKVQPDWLHDYLLEPVAIRPAAVLRMPKYAMSAEEASKLVDYFAAAAGAEFPYTSDPRGSGAALAAKEQDRPNRLDDALRIVLDRTTFCTKCHLLNDYSPGGTIRTVLAPRLDRAGRRLRPEYLRRWLAHPQAVLPYTGMPVNFPPVGPPLGQDLFPGDSLQQVDAVTDLLLNYDAYMGGRTSIRALIESARPTSSPAKSGEE